MSEKKAKIPQKKETAEEWADKMIQEAEVTRARVYDLTGKEKLRLEHSLEMGQEGRISSLMDEDYQLVASHMDEQTRQKIVQREYIDFVKLIRKDRFTEEEEQKMMMVNKGGLSYWVQMTDHSQAITSYHKWDMAFHVFLDIYMNHHLNRTSELIQYGYIINTASMSYAWENVYLYDREFQKHMERHPLLRWGVILQQAWTMFLKDRNNHTPHHKGNGSGNGHNQGTKPSGAYRHLCFDFNEGVCTYGSKCRFENKCSFCLKYGHGALNCRRAAARANQNKNNNNILVKKLAQQPLHRIIGMVNKSCKSTKLICFCFLLSYT